MCRMLAMTSNRRTNLRISFDKLSKIAQLYSHKDGWGIAWLDRHNRFELHKGPKPIWESRTARRLIQNVQSNLIVIHARKSKKNDASRKRSHPFKHVALGREWIFLHNGGIDCPTPLRHRPRSDVDSERFFCYLLDVMEIINSSKTLDEKKLVSAALKETLKNTTVKTALNFVMASPKNLFVFRYYNTNPDYYNILYLKRFWKSKKGLELNKKVGEIATIFSSQPLSEDEKWYPLENTRLVAVPTGIPEKLETLDKGLGRENMISRKKVALIHE